MSNKIPGAAIEKSLALLKALHDAREEMTVHQALLLLELARMYSEGRDSPTQEEIGDRLGIVQGAASRIIKLFVRGGLLTKTTSPHSERNKVYEMTPKGRLLMIKIRDILA